MSAPAANTDVERLAQVLAESNGTPWDFVRGGAGPEDPYYRDARAVMAHLNAMEDQR